MKLKVAIRSSANALLISCLARILGKNVACNYIVSLILHKYVERCVSLCIVGVANLVSDQEPAVFGSLQATQRKVSTLCLVILQRPLATPSKPLKILLHFTCGSFTEIC